MLRRLFGSRARREYEKGIELFNAGSLLEAIACFDASLDGASSNDPDATLARFYRGDAQARLGAQALVQGEARKALSFFDAALVDHPSYPDLHHQRGLALLVLEDALAAEHAARKAVELNADFVEAGVLLVLALAAQGNGERAKQEQARWAQLAESKGHPLRELLDEPEPQLTALLRYRSAQRDRRRRIESAEGLLHSGFWKDAQALLEQLVTETPHYPDLRLRLAAALASQSDLESAAGHLEAALERNPNFDDAHVLAGIVALHRGRVREASHHFECAEDHENLSSPVMYGHALCELRSGEIRGARRRLDSIWQEEEFLPEARFLRASLTGLDGDATEALMQFTNAVHSTERSDLLLDAAAWGLQENELGLVRRAVDALPPGAPDSSVALVRAELLLREDSKERAVDVLMAATADHPDDPAVLWRLAVLHAERGEVDVALRRLSNLDALGIAVPGAPRLSARLYRGRGEFERALHALETAAPVADDDIESALEQLYVLRLMGDQDAVLQLGARWARLAPLDIRWRIQQSGRWHGPLAFWPRALPERDR